MNKTAIILGTARYHGNTRQLISLIEQHMDVDVFLLEDFNISPFDYEHNNSDDDFIGLIEQLLPYQHWAFASPVYWYAMSAQLKVFVDRLSDLLTIKKDLGRQLRGKSASVIATSASEQLPECFNTTFALTFNYLGMEHRQTLHCFFDEGVQPTDFKPQVADYVAAVDF